MSWLARLANAFRQQELRREIEEELRFHLEARGVDNLARGMPPGNAGEDAARRFGSARLSLDKTHDADRIIWLESIFQDLRYGLRSLRANPGVTALALVSLALAIGANTAMFSVVNMVLLRALPYQDPDRIAMLWLTDTLNGAREVNSSVPNFHDLQARSRMFRHLAMYRWGPASVTLHGESNWMETAFIYGDFFSVLGRNAVLGRLLDGAPEGRQVVLSYRLWQGRFGGAADVIGRTINLNGAAFEISGVMPQDFRFPMEQTQLWAPAPAWPDWQSRRTRRGSGFGAVVGSLQPGVTLKQARAEAEGIGRQLAREYPTDNAEHGIDLVPLAAQIHGRTVPLMLAVLFGAVTFVLLTACANVANLMLARGAVRAPEIRLRAALGAGRTRIIRQLLTESLLLSLLAGVLALPVAGWGIPAIVAMAPAGIARIEEAHIDGRVLVFSLVLSLGTGILFGLAPAVRISEGVTGRRQSAGLSARKLRRAFVVAEVSLAMVLVTGAGLLLRSFAALQAVDPGFQTEHVLAATLRCPNTPPDRRAAVYRQVTARICALPGVIAAGGISRMFFSGDQPKFGLRAIEGRASEAPARWTPMTWSSVGGDYFQALGIPLLEGRFFNDRDSPDAPPVVIINETMARRYWPGQDPIGKGIKGFDARGRHDDWVRVVGVVKDMRSRGLEHEPMAQIYEAQIQSGDPTENFVIRTTLSAAAVRDAIRAIDRAAIWPDVTTLAGQLRQQNAPRRFQTLLVSVFAAMALALAGAGIFGMMYFSVAQRTQEIGIRVALGARPADVIGLVVREGLFLVGMGAAAGLAGSLALARSLRSLLFSVAPGDPATLTAVSLLLVIVALAACYIPARRATRIDPAVALRHD